MTIDEVRAIAGALPGAYEQASYDDRPSWRTKPRMFAIVADDVRRLAVWTESVEEKEAMLASDPQVFSTTPHYDGHAIVLVDLDRVDGSELTELVTESWRLRAPRRLVTAWEREEATRSEDDD